MPKKPRLDERTRNLAKSYAKLKSYGAVGAAQTPPITGEAVRQVLQKAFDAGLLKPPAFLEKLREGGQTPVREKVAALRARRAATRVCKTCEVNRPAKGRVDCPGCIEAREEAIVQQLRGGATEAVVSKRLGISQQNVSKIKLRIERETGVPIAVGA